MDLHLFGWLHSLSHCLHGGAVCAPFVGQGEQGPPALPPACDSLPTSSCRQGEAGVDRVLSVCPPALHYLGFSSFCSSAWAVAGKEAAAGAMGELGCAD